MPLSHRAFHWLAGSIVCLVQVSTGAARPLRLTSLKRKLIKAQAPSQQKQGHGWTLCWLQLFYRMFTYAAAYPWSLLCPVSQVRLIDAAGEVQGDTFWYDRMLDCVINHFR